MRRRERYEIRIINERHWWILKLMGFSLGFHYWIMLLISIVFLFESYFDGLNSSWLALRSTELPIFVPSCVPCPLKMSRVVDVVFLGVFSRNPNRKPLQSSRLTSGSREAALSNIPSITKVSEMREVLELKIRINCYRTDWEALKYFGFPFSS